MHVFLTAIWLPHCKHWGILEDSLTNPMLITAFLQFKPEGHRECKFLDLQVSNFNI